MEKGVKSKRNLAISIGVLTIVAVVVFVFCYTSVWTGDDIEYQFNFAVSEYLATDSAVERIGSLSDLFESQWVHYLTVNGRYVAHWLVQLYCGLLGKTAFAISNALVYVAFIILLVKFVGRTLRDVWCLCTVTLLLLLMFDTIYGPACQIGFVWTFALSMSWLYLFFRSTAKSLSACIGLFLFSVIAGQGQEALNIGISGALIIYAATNRKSMTPGQWAMFFGFGAGALTLCLSPASIGRAEELTVPFYYTLFHTVSFMRVTYLFLIVLLIARFRWHISLRAFCKENSFYFNAMFILLIFNLLWIGVYGNRQLFGIEIMALILTLKLLPQCRLNVWGLAALSLLVLGIYGQRWTKIQNFKVAYEEFVNLYFESKDGVVYYDMFRHNSKSIEKLLRSEGHDKKLTVYPACLEAFKGVAEVENQVVKFDDGCFVVIQSKKHPAKFILKREINAFVYRHPFKDYVFTWDNPLMETDAYRANVIYEEIPFVDNIDVEIVE